MQSSCQDITRLCVSKLQTSITVDLANLWKFYLLLGTFKSQILWNIIKCSLSICIVLSTSLLDTKKQGSLNAARWTNKYGTFCYITQHSVKFQFVILTLRLKLWIFFLCEMQFRIWMLYLWLHITQIIILIHFVQYLLLLQCSLNDCESWYVKNLQLSKPLVTKCRDLG